jgi:hypothetical protein
MAIGGVAAWRMTKKENATTSSAETPTWRDDSLDDWRRQRDAAAQDSRVAREHQTSESHAGAGTEEQVETVRHQRIGG